MKKVLILFAIIGLINLYAAEDKNDKNDKKEETVKEKSKPEIQLPKATPEEVEALKHIEEFTKD